MKALALSLFANHEVPGDLVSHSIRERQQCFICFLEFLSYRNGLGTVHLTLAAFYASPCISRIDP